MTEALALRYGGAVPDFPPQLNHTLSAFLAQASCRAYLDRALPEGMLETLMAAAQSAPSSCNMHCWSVVALADPAERPEIARISGGQRHVIEAPLLLVFLADLARIETVAAWNDTPAEALDYLEMLLTGVIDAALAAQTFVLAAQSHGLGTCYIGSLRNDIAAVSRRLSLPAKVAPVFGLTLGYPDAARPARVKPRPAQSALLHHGRYDASASLAAVADYEEAMEAFNRAEGRSTAPWGLHSARRLIGPSAMEGRDTLLSLLQEQGLALK